MRYRLHLRAEAAADIAEATEWYDRQQSGLGAEFMRSVRSQLAAIEEVPKRYPVILSDIRRARLRRFPYGVYYVIDGEIVVAFACMHARQSPRQWQSRR